MLDSFSGEASSNCQGTENFNAIVFQNIINLQITLWNLCMPKPKPNLKKKSLKRIAFDYKCKNPPTKFNSILLYTIPQHATLLILGRWWIQWVKYKCRNVTYDEI